MCLKINNNLHLTHHQNRIMFVLFTKPVNQIKICFENETHHNLVASVKNVHTTMSFCIILKLWSERNRYPNKAIVVNLQLKKKTPPSRKTTPLPLKKKTSYIQCNIKCNPLHFCLKLTSLYHKCVQRGEYKNID